MDQALNIKKNLNRKKNPLFKNPSRISIGLTIFNSRIFILSSHSCIIFFFCFSCVLLLPPFFSFFFFFFWTFVTFVSTNESYRPAASYQPSERSDFSFDNLSTTDNNVQSKQPQSLPPPQQPHQSQLSRNVQRSVSQPECANEKSLFKWVWSQTFLSGLNWQRSLSTFHPLRNVNAIRSDIDDCESFCRCSKFSSFNQPMDDTNENWNIFAPIAKLESLDEIDQVW